MVSDPLLGQVLDGTYSVEMRLGKGGMGTVYLATHVGTGRPVAVKVIAPDYMERSEFIERFRREAQAAGRLRHPNVVDVTDFGFSSTKGGPDVAYLVMEYLDGCTLGEILDEEKKLPVAWSIDIIDQVCSAVQEAHRQGIIHRDLKPDNIWLEPNQRGGYTVKVLDFGIAKLEETELGLAKSEIEHRTAARGTIADDALHTFVEDRGSATLAEKGSSTVVSEGETLTIDPGAKNSAVESEPGETEGTSRIVSGVNLEGGTAIMEPSVRRSDPGVDQKLTVLANNDPDTDKQDRSSHSTAALTRMGAVLGTPLYMSPEQCRGERLTPRSDIYSLAVIMYQMFSGKMPFEGDYLNVMEGHKNEEPPPLTSRKINKRLRRTVMNALAKSPEDRPDTAEAFASKLRANSEGLWTLLTRAFVIYAERLPKFLLLSLITFIPLILVTFVRVGLNFLVNVRYIPDNLAVELAGIGLSIFGFFLQIVSVALLVGMTTWVVGQILAYPLRPLNLWAAFREARTRFQSLAGTVTVSVLISTVGLVLFFIPGVYLSARFALIAPAVMMEGVKGRAAFRRSAELSKRSFRTIFGVVLLSFFVPAITALIIGLSIGSIIGNFEKAREIDKMKTEIAEMKRKGVESQPAEEEGKDPDAGSDKSEKSGGISFNLGTKGVRIGDREEEGMAKSLTASIREGIFELLWTPLALLIASFTSVISALIYFKTRQAGGETMQGLLSKLNSANSPQSKWQQRVNDRLVQSGRISSGSGST
jgi:serine/threonine protein kinase